MIRPSCLLKFKNITLFKKTPKNQVSSSTVHHFPYTSNRIFLSSSSSSQECISNRKQLICIYNDKTTPPKNERKTRRTIERRTSKWRSGSWSRDVTIDLFGLLDNICYKHFLQSVKKNAQRYKTCIKLIPRISG